MVLEKNTIDSEYLVYLFKVNHRLEIPLEMVSVIKT